ncbi:hypothetical protein LPJ61_001204 [Coemansia biformis]|uniref:Cytochrome P450 n=1 Tax=Coemansia biformis TaxID=1286918 RepID=A0A9W7YET0_9FUNG|nr:hypothetical protein LPJ61_001204 [Coemansia biformis]
MARMFWLFANYMGHMLRTLTLSANNGPAGLPPLSQRLYDALTMLLRPTTLLLLATCYVVYRIVYKLAFSPLCRVPGPLRARVSSLPSLLECLTQCTNDVMVRDSRLYGSLFVMEPKKVAVCDVEDCRTILGSHAFAKAELYGNVDFMEPNIFLTRDAKLNSQRRRQIGPALNKAGLRRMEPTILAAGVQQLMSRWDSCVHQAAGARAQVNYYSDMTLMSFDIIASLGFGMEHRSLTTGDRTIGDWVEKTFALMILQMVVPAVKWWPLRRIVGAVLGKHVDAFFAFGKQAIERRKLALATASASAEPRPNDILQQFIDAEDPLNRIKMTSSQVITETIMIMLSGADTTSTSLAWTIHLLMLYPEHRQALVEQIRAAFGRDQLITYEMAREHLPLLEACIFESLRVCPVSTNLPRVVPKGGVTLQGHFIPGGYTLAVSTAACNYNPQYWPDPARFDPARFLRSNPDYDTNRHNLMTLSSGVRSCPGHQLVMVEMMTTLANILNRYDLELPADAHYGPHNLGADGLPTVMPRTNHIAMIPKHPERDCSVVVSMRP